MKPEISFHPAGNKKKPGILGVSTGGNLKSRNRTPLEKKERIWGKTPQKPYISSSIGDMARVMMRLACMENTYFYNQEPPAVEFYDFWQRFSVEPPHIPTEFIDTKRQSIANLRTNTSSFNFYGKYTEPVTSRHGLEGGVVSKISKKKLVVKSNEQKLSDIWKDVRISMSTESFISASTKISENASAVQLETPWDDACSEDYQSSESDQGFDIQDHHRHHRHKQAFWQFGTDSQAPQEEKTSSLEFHTPQGLIDKQTNAITQSLLALQKKDNRILVELATRPTDMDIIDHFADDLDDSFLLDSYSYSDLPDEVFGPEFDFFNEDKLYKKKGKKGKGEGASGRRDSTGGAERGPSTGDEDSNDAGEDQEHEGKKISAEDDESSGSECVPETDEQRGLTKGAKSKKRRGRKAKKSKSQQSDRSDEGSVGGYQACMERRRKRIEDSLRAAVRCRSPMGSYRPKPGEEPLSKALQLNSPGPAAYNPSLNAVKPNLHTALLAPRWTKDIYETPGPGPAMYCPNPKCTCEMLTLHEAPRFKDSETLGPGPACFNLANVYGTAKDKPKALILSRKNKFQYTMGGQFTNCYGLNRYGKANSPNPLIISRKVPTDAADPGPGEYDPNEMKDTRVGIKMKSRIPQPFENEKSPGFHMLPGSIGSRGGYSFGIKKFMEMKDQSPGPIYQINKFKPKPVSLTFRPFPMKGAELEPSPIEWGTKPGKAKIKVLPRAPCPILHGNHDPLFGKYKTPGPNQYNICLECMECTEPGASLKGRYPTKSERTPGPADYTPIPVWKRPPMPVFQHKWKEPKKKKDDEESPPPKTGVPFGPAPKHRIVGGLMTPRWRDREDDDDSPELLNIFGLTNRGNKTAIPLSLKSRHTPFKYSHMADPKTLTFRTGKGGVCD